MRNFLNVTWVLIRRALNEITRVPGAAIPGVLAPTIFMIGISGVFGKVTSLPGFTTDDFHAFIVPVGLLQGAGFAGAAMGVNLARDIEQGWFDRMILSPAPRSALLAGTIFSASIRCLMPATALILVSFALGVPWPGFDGLAIALILMTSASAVAACASVTLAIKFKTQQAAPLMQAATFASILSTTAYAPQVLLTGWLKPTAKYNPVTKVLEGIRQGFVGDVSWAVTWPAFAAVLGMGLVFGAFAMRRMRNAGE